MQRSATVTIVGLEPKARASVGLYRCQLTERNDTGLTVSGEAVIEFPFRRIFSEALQRNAKLHLLIRVSAAREELFCDGLFKVAKMELVTGDEQEARYSFEVAASRGEYSIADRSAT